MEIQTITLQIKYYSPKNKTGPSVEGCQQGADEPNSTLSVKLKSDENFLVEMQKVHEAVFNLSAHRSFLFRLMVPAQTRSLCSIVASLFPATTSLINAVGNPIIVLFGMIFS